MSSNFFHIQIILAHTKQFSLSHSHSKKLAFEVQQKRNEL
jgi:hypothetical protein